MRPESRLGSSVLLRLVLSAWLTLTLLALSTSPAIAAPAAEIATATLFQEATTALKSGAFEQAIAGFERLSDLGFVDAAASYNRALAYIQRSETQKTRPGDLGQAVAALREADQLGYKDGTRLLERVRDHIGRTRARRQKEAVSAEAPLAWVVVGLLPENVLAGLSALGSLSFACGMWLRRARFDSPRRLTGNILATSGIGFLAVFGLLAYAAKVIRETTQEAVVIVAEAPLLDEAGNPVRAKRVGRQAGGSSASPEDASVIPEGASVYVLLDKAEAAANSGSASLSGTRGDLIHIRWGAVEAQLRAIQVRRLSR